MLFYHLITFHGQIQFCHGAVIFRHIEQLYLGFLPIKLPDPLLDIGNTHMLTIGS